MDIGLGGVVIAAAVAAIAFGVTRALVVARARRRADRRGSAGEKPVSRQVRRAQERKNQRR